MIEHVQGAHRVHVAHGEAHAVREGERGVHASGIVTYDKRRNVVGLERGLRDRGRDPVRESANDDQFLMRIRHRSIPSGFFHRGRAHAVRDERVHVDCLARRAGRARHTSRTVRGRVVVPSASFTLPDSCRRAQQEFHPLRGPEARR